MTAHAIFHSDFKPEPYWWEAYRYIHGDVAAGNT